MSPAIFAGIFACLSYGAAAFLLVRSLRTNIPVNRFLLLGTALAGLALHAVHLGHALFDARGIELGLVNMLSLFGFALVASGTFIIVFRDIYSLMAPAYPAACLAVLVNLLGHDRVAPHLEMSSGLAAHILASILAYSVIALALSQAMLLWIQNYQLKNRHIRDILHLLPPLQTMEHTLFDLIAIGLGLLTLANGLGFLFVSDLFAQHLIHKTVFSIAAWAVLLLLLLGRYQWGWRGMKAVKWTLTAFILLTLGYFGSKVVLEVILVRA